MVLPLQNIGILHVITKLHLEALKKYNKEVEYGQLFFHPIKSFSNLDGAAQKTVVMHDGKPHIIKYGSQLAPKKIAPDQGSYQHAPICEQPATVP